MQHNKKREELQRLKEKYPEEAARIEAKALVESEGDSSSSDEDEDDGYIDDETEVKIFETLLKIRRKDRSIYDKDVKFFDETKDNINDDFKEPKKKKEKPVYLKDMVYREAVETAEKGALSDSDDEYEASKHQTGTYVEEQQELKKAFLNAAASIDDQENIDLGSNALLKSSTKGRHESIVEVEDGLGQETENKKLSHDKVQELLDTYFGGQDKKVSEDERFLKTYILNKGWVEKGDGYSMEEDFDNDAELEEDEEAWEAAEAFEARYNFRFEEPGGTELISHPRKIEGTVRKEDDKRKKQRAEREARKKAEEESRRAEIRRLKNLKKAEIEQKLTELKTVAGSAAPDDYLLNHIITGDFDPETHDRVMAAAFGENYYDAGANESEDDLQDELFERELEAMAKYGSDDDADEFIANAKTSLGKEKAKTENLTANTEEDNAQEDEERAKNEMKRLVEEYHKIDYEDHVGGMKTRFRYKEVEPETFGLSIEEILEMDDKELNQIVGLKTVAATYRDKSKKVRPNYGKLNEIRKSRGFGSEGKRNKHISKISNGFDGKEINTKDSNQNGTAEKSKEAVKDQRLASFATLSLKKRKDVDMGDSLMKEKKAKKSHIEQKVSGVARENGSGLTKAQKKNARRAAKRAQKRAANLAAEENKA